MNASMQALRHFQPRTGPTARSTHKVIGLTVGITLLGALGACSGVSSVTKERVAQSQASVQQAQQTLGQSEYGAVELRQAKDKLSAANGAVVGGKEQDAQRAAMQAHLYADLAVAKSQSAIARKAADEALASVETLRQETERASPTPR